MRSTQQPKLGTWSPWTNRRASRVALMGRTSMRAMKPLPVERITSAILATVFVSAAPALALGEDVPPNKWAEVGLSVGLGVGVAHAEKTAAAVAMYIGPSAFSRSWRFSLLARLHSSNSRSSFAPTSEMAILVDGAGVAVIGRLPVWIELSVGAKLTRRAQFQAGAAVRPEVWRHKSTVLTVGPEISVAFEPITECIFDCLLVGREQQISLLGSARLDFGF
jgi:hypothetical protein